MRVRCVSVQSGLTGSSAVGVLIDDDLCLLDIANRQAMKSLSALRKSSLMEFELKIKHIEEPVDDFYCSCLTKASDQHLVAVEELQSSLRLVRHEIAIRFR
jgi:hypothetical protein